MPKWLTVWMEACHWPSKVLAPRLMCTGLLVTLSVALQVFGQYTPGSLSSTHP